MKQSQKEKTPKRIAILGSTGSIGTQTLEVVSGKPEEFEVQILTAHSNAGLLIEQTRKFLPDTVVITDESKYFEVKEALKSLPVKVFAGNDSVSDLVCLDSVDLVLASMVGFAGLGPVISAAKAGKRIALANKETLVVAGEIISKLVNEYRSVIIPVDSEHSAIFQCLVGENENSVEKIILTASGGPFRDFPSEKLATVTINDALCHPTWKMGRKITVDSATMMNKGLEVIEAHWLFGAAPSEIEVVVHPQSIIHSLVQFRDGSLKAQLGLPDMRLPIAYALTWPDRLNYDFPRLNLAELGQMTFTKPDRERFKALDLAYQALERGGNIPCAMNAANEIAVAAFLENKVSFLKIPQIIESVMNEISYLVSPGLDELKETDKEARLIAGTKI